MDLRSRSSQEETAEEERARRQEEYGPSPRTVGPCTCAGLGRGHSVLLDLQMSQIRREVIARELLHLQRYRRFLEEEVQKEFEAELGMRSWALAYTETPSLPSDVEAAGIVGDTQRQAVDPEGAPSVGFPQWKDFHIGGAPTFGSLKRKAAAPPFGDPQWKAIRPTFGDPQRKAVPPAFGDPPRKGFGIMNGPAFGDAERRAPDMAISFGVSQRKAADIGGNPTFADPQRRTVDVRGSPIFGATHGKEAAPAFGVPQRKTVDVRGTGVFLPQKALAPTFGDPQRKVVDIGSAPTFGDTRGMVVAPAFGDTHGKVVAPAFGDPQQKVLDAGGAPTFGNPKQQVVSSTFIDLVETGSPPTFGVTQGKVVAPSFGDDTKQKTFPSTFDDPQRKVIDIGSAPNFGDIHGKMVAPTFGDTQGKVDAPTFGELQQKAVVIGGIPTFGDPKQKTISPTFDDLKGKVVPPTSGDPQEKVVNNGRAPTVGDTQGKVVAPTIGESHQKAAVVGSIPTFGDPKQKTVSPTFVDLKGKVVPPTSGDRQQKLVDIGRAPTFGDARGRVVSPTFRVVGGIPTFGDPKQNTVAPTFDVPKRMAVPPTFGDLQRKVVDIGRAPNSGDTQGKMVAPTFGDILGKVVVPSFDDTQGKVVAPTCSDPQGKAVVVGAVPTFGVSEKKTVVPTVGDPQRKPVDTGGVTIFGASPEKVVVPTFDDPLRKAIIVEDAPTFGDSQQKMVGPSFGDEQGKVVAPNLSDPHPKAVDVGGTPTSVVPRRKVVKRTVVKRRVLNIKDAPSSRQPQQEAVAPTSSDPQRNFVDVGGSPTIGDLQQKAVDVAGVPNVVDQQQKADADDVRCGPTFGNTQSTAFVPTLSDLLKKAGDIGEASTLGVSLLKAPDVPVCPSPTVGDLQQKLANTGDVPTFRDSQRKAVAVGGSPTNSDPQQKAIAPTTCDPKQKVDDSIVILPQQKADNSGEAPTCDPQPKAVAPYINDSQGKEVYIGGAPTLDDPQRKMVYIKIGRSLHLQRLDSAIDTNGAPKTGDTQQITADTEGASVGGKVISVEPPYSKKSGTKRKADDPAHAPRLFPHPSRKEKTSDSDHGPLVSAKNAEVLDHSIDQMSATTSVTLPPLLKVDPKKTKEATIDVKKSLHGSDDGPLSPMLIEANKPFLSELDLYWNPQERKKKHVWCKLCGVICVDENGLVSHLAGKRHRNNKVLIAKRCPELNAEASGTSIVEVKKVNNGGNCTIGVNRYNQVGTSALGEKKANRDGTSALDIKKANINGGGCPIGMSCDKACKVVKEGINKIKASRNRDGTPALIKEEINKSIVNRDGVSVLDLKKANIDGGDCPIGTSSDKACKAIKEGINKNMVSEIEQRKEIATFSLTKNNLVGVEVAEIVGDLVSVVGVEAKFDGKQNELVQKSQGEFADKQGSSTPTDDSIGGLCQGIENSGITTSANESSGMTSADKEGTPLTENVQNIINVKETSEEFLAVGSINLNVTGAGVGNADNKICVEKIVEESAEPGEILEEVNNESIMKTQNVNGDHMICHSSSGTNERFENSERLLDDGRVERKEALVEGNVEKTSDKFVHVGPTDQQLGDIIDGNGVQKRLRQQEL